MIRILALVAALVCAVPVRTPESMRLSALCGHVNALLQPFRSETDCCDLA